MIEDISKLYQKILEEQKESNKKVQPIEEKKVYLNEDNNLSDLDTEEPFDSFLLKLGEKLQEEIIEKEVVPNNINEDSNENVIEIPEEPKNNYVNELRKIDKPSSKKVLKENEEITNIISEQIQEEIGKVKTQISRMAIEGGGGSVAVQYANGGTMRGDLNVTGKYLSAGIDLSTLIGSGGGGGGGLSGTTDRLISGSQVFKLNTDGTFNFPNNIITPQDEVILTLESTKVLDNYYNRLALSPYGFFASDHNENSITIDSTNNEILIDSQNTYFWKFNNQGALEGPFGTLSVSGNLSASNVVYASGGNSDLWNSTFTTVNANSAQWAVDSTTDTGVRGLTGKFDSTYTTVYSNSANWQGLYTTVQTNSSTWVNGISAQVILARVFNADSVTMNKGDVVYTFGATGDVMSVKLASNVSEATSSKTLGFVNETISTGGIGYVVIAGQIDKMSFPNPFQEGDALWLGETAGTFTRVKPTAPNHLVYLGVVERANNGNGLAYVKVQNGYELDELHDVQITSVSAGDVLQRNATNTLWVNSPLSADKWNSSYTTVKTNSAAWAAPSTFFQAYEHFITGGGIGLLGITYSGSNGGSVTQVTTNPAVFGAVRIATANNSAANTGARINGSGTINTINPTGVGEFRYVSRIMQFSTDFFSSTCRGIFRTGVGDSINAAPSNGFFFSATESNTVNFNTVSGGITTSTPTGFSIIQNQWNLFEFIISASGTSVTAKINGNTVATHTTNIPNAYMYPITNILKYQADAGFIQLDVDYIYISLTQ